jgi:hypothetical protein
MPERSGAVPRARRPVRHHGPLLQGGLRHQQPHLSDAVSCRWADVRASRRLLQLQLHGLAVEMRVHRRRGRAWLLRLERQELHRQQPVLLQVLLGRLLRLALQTHRRQLLGRLRLLLRRLREHLPRHPSALIRSAAKTSGGCQRYQPPRRRAAAPRSIARLTRRGRPARTVPFIAWIA